MIPAVMFLAVVWPRLPHRGVLPKTPLIRGAVRRHDHRNLELLQDGLREDEEGFQ